MPAAEGGGRRRGGEQSALTERLFALATLSAETLSWAQFPLPRRESGLTWAFVCSGRYSSEGMLKDSHRPSIASLARRSFTSSILSEWLSSSASPSSPRARFRRVVGNCAFSAAEKASMNVSHTPLSSRCSGSGGRPRKGLPCTSPFCRQPLPRGRGACEAAREPRPRSVREHNGAHAVGGGPSSRRCDSAPEHGRAPADAAVVAELRGRPQPGLRVVRAAGGRGVTSAVRLPLELLQLRHRPEGPRAPAREVVQAARRLGAWHIAAVAARRPVEHAGELVVLRRVRDVRVQRREHLPRLAVRALAGEARVAELLELAKHNLVALREDALLGDAPRLLRQRRGLQGCAGGGEGHRSRGARQQGAAVNGS